MKMLLKIVGGIIVCLALLLVVFRITGLNPHDRIPGLWLSGEAVTTPVADWSFIDQVPNIKIQTQSRFLLPHSVTINCLAYNGQFYVSSTRPGGAPRSWDENVRRDPHVRIKIGDKLYDRTLVLVTDPAEKEAVVQVREKKYQLKVPAGSTIDVFHVVG
ncbi:MAG TPA: nitroreductase/quinone reductase family protein [Bryobacteraceae bacterium]|nr:nitroreductase/quinone reductase family protein [Bryobacteraceae bacterium]